MSTSIHVSKSIDPKSFIPLKDSRGKEVNSANVVESLMNDFLKVIRGNYAAESTRAAVENILPILEGIQGKGFEFIMVKSDSLLNDYIANISALIAAASMTFATFKEVEKSEVSGKARAIEL